MSVQRNKRISEEIKKIVSALMRHGLKDPRISPMATITEVKTTRDLRFVYIYVTVFESEEKRKPTVDALNKAKGFVRKAIGSELNLRYTPEPIFKLDESIENAMHIESIIRKVSKDAEDKASVEVESEDEQENDDE